LAALLIREDKALKKFRWGVTSLSASQWIPWIAKEAKLYEKYGLEAELVLLARLRGNRRKRSSAIASSGACTLTTVMSADLSGADLVTVAHTVFGVQSKLLVRPGDQKAGRSARQKSRGSPVSAPGDFLERLHHKKIRSRAGSRCHHALHRQST
jgi:hypothetical protein